MFSLKRYDWTLHLLTIALCAYFLARGATTYVAGLLESYSSSPVAEATTPTATAGGEQKEATLDDYKSIAERNIFNSAESAVAKEANPDEMNPTQLGELGPAVKTTLTIKVLSTLAIGDGTDRRSSAVVSGEKSKNGEPYFPNDTESFAPNVKLTKVMKDRIEFIHNGRLEYAELEDFTSKKNVFASAEEVFGKGKETSKDKEKPTDTPAEGGKIVLDQKEIDEALQNLDKLYSDVRIVPNFKDGKPDGMKVLSIRPGSLASKLSIRRGDVLTRLNGQDLDIKRGMELFGTMKDSKNFSLEVERGGRNQTLEYEIR